MFAWIRELLDRRVSWREREMQHELDLRVCNSCEMLREELTRSHSREKELIGILKSPKETEEAPPFRSGIDISNRPKPWSVKRQELEKANRKVTVDNLDDEIELVKENAN